MLFVNFLEFANSYSNWLFSAKISSMSVLPLLKDRRNELSASTAVSSFSIWGGCANLSVLGVLCLQYFGITVFLFTWPGFSPYRTSLAAFGCLLCCTNLSMWEEVWGRDIDLQLRYCSSISILFTSCVAEYKEFRNCIFSLSRNETSYERKKMAIEIQENMRLYVIIMSRTRFRVNLHSIVAWMSRNSLLERRDI